MFVNLKVEVSNWFTYTDGFGQASIPGRQIVTLEGEYIKIVMDFSVASGDINRLFCPYKRGLWSNFEALGADCTVKIYKKTYSIFDFPHFFPRYTLNNQFLDSNAGLEYGYLIPGIVV